jgi:hypothetical protein
MSGHGGGRGGGGAGGGMGVVFRIHAGPRVLVLLIFLRYTVRQVVRVVVVMVMMMMVVVKVVRGGSVLRGG